MLKYKNREYGFEGRPPFFLEFTEESDRPDGADEGECPGVTRVGFGLDPKTPEGIFFGGRNGSMWNAALYVKKKGKYVPVVDPAKLTARDLELGAGARFAIAATEYGAFRFTVEGENAAVFEFMPKAKLKLRLVARPAGSAIATLQSERDLIKGRAFRRGVIPGEIELLERGAMIRNRFTVTKDEGDQKDYFALKSYEVPDESEVTARAIFYDYEAAAFKPLLFFASIGEKTEALNVPKREDAAEILSKAALRAESSDERGAGVAAGRKAALTEIRKHLVYDPYLMTPVLSEDKETEDGYFGYDGLNRGLGAVIAAAAGETEAAEAMALTAAADPVFGALAVFVVYRRTKNKEFLKSALPRAMEIWNGGDKLIVADPKEKRELSYRQPGSPLNEDLFRKGAAYSVDLSSYRLLAYRLTKTLLEETGVDATDYAEKIDASVKALNEILFRKELGVYMNRHLTGEWATGYGFTSFLPMLAGAANDAETVNELYLTLKNPKKFWDNALFPTLAKDNYYYGRKGWNADGEKSAKYENYSGMIAPWANYLMYAAFRAVGMGDLSFALADSSEKLFEREYARGGEYPSFYRPDLRHSTSDEKHALSALMMPLFGSMELLDFDYAEEGALRFGVTESGVHAVNGVLIEGRRMDYRKSDDSGSLYMDGAEVFRGEPGNFEIRGFCERDNEIGFYFRAEEAVKLTIRTPFFAGGDKRKITFRLEAGKHRVGILDGKVRVQTVSVA